MDLQAIEELELKYLDKFFYFLKFSLDEIQKGLKTRDKISKDWEGKGLYNTKISDYSTGAERVIYSLLNGEQFGIPNSAPVGSDLFFEADDAFIHIDLKTVGTTLSPIKKIKADNIGDFKKDIFIGTNQNSYSSEILINEGKPNQFSRNYQAHLPPIYNRSEQYRKTCLTYFITILYDKDTLDTLVINLLCMPNGELKNIYKNKPIKAGKNPNKARFNFSRTPEFELLNKKKRVKIVFFQESMDEKYRKKLKWQYNLYKNQK